MIGEIVPKVIGLFLMPIFTRYLSPEDYGIMSYTESIAVFMYAFAILSLNSYLLRNYSEFSSEIEKKKFVGNLFVFIMSYNIVFILVFSVILSVVFEIMEIQVGFYPYMFLALLTNFFNIFAVIPMALYRIQEKAGKFVGLSLISTLLQITLSLVLIIVFDQGILGRYYGILIVSILFAGVYLNLMRKEVIFNFNYLQLREALKFSLPLVPASISFLLLDISDRLILEQYVSLNEMGIYSIAYILGFAVNVVIVSGYKFFEPVLFKNVQQENFIRIFYDIKNIFLFFVFSMGLLFLLFSQEILYIMATTDFYEAYMLVPIIVVAAVIKGLYMLYGVLIMVKRKTKMLSMAVVLGALVNIGINIMFIPTYGIMAAAISTVFGFLTVTIFSHVLVYHCFRLNLYHDIKDYFSILLLSLIGYILFYNVELDLCKETFVLKSIIFTVGVWVFSKIYKVDILKNFLLKI